MGDVLVVGFGQTQCRVDFDFRLLSTSTQKNRVLFAHGNAITHGCTRRDQSVPLTLGAQWAAGGVGQIEGARDAIGREVGVGGAEHRLFVELAGVDIQRQIVACAEHVLLANTGHKRELLGL